MKQSSRRLISWSVGRLTRRGGGGSSIHPGPFSGFHSRGVALKYQKPEPTLSDHWIIPPGGFRTSLDQLSFDLAFSEQRVLLQIIEL